MSLGLYIKQLRVANNQTLHQVAVGTDIDATLLSKIERSARLPTKRQIEKLAIFFDISVKTLQIQAIAEKIIKNYGLNEITIAALHLVEKEFSLLNKKSNNDKDIAQFFNK